MRKVTDYKNTFNSLHKRIILNNYYTGKIKRGKNLYASLLDWLFITMVISLIVYIIAYNVSNSLLISTLLTAVSASFYLALLYLGNKKVRNKKIAEINDEIAHKSIIREISKYNNRDFLLWLKEILEMYYNTTFHLHAQFIDLIGEINGEIYAVKCIRRPEDVKVTLRDLENFIQEIKEKNIKEAIVVTTSYFSEEVKEKLDYILLDIHQIKRILKEIGQYPTREDIEADIISEYNFKKENMKKVLKNRSRNRIFKFLLLGLALYIYSFFVPYKSYYRLIAFISIGIGTALALYNVVKYVEGIHRKA